MQPSNLFDYRCTPYRASCRCAVRAFTLIELLVVISIIALLVAILLPALQASRTTAHQVASLSNIRQITMAMNTYAVDNDGSLMISRWDYDDFDPPNHGSHGMYWAGQLVRDGYIADRNVYWSPAKDTSQIRNLNTSNYGHFAPWRWPGYAANFYMMPSFEKHFDFNRPVANINKVNPFQPGEALILLDVWDTRGGDYQQGLNKVFPKTGIGQRAFTYHGDPVHSYLDGHAVAGQADHLHWDEGGGPRLGNWDMSPVTHPSSKVAPWFNRWWTN